MVFELFALMASEVVSSFTLWHRWSV